MRRGARFVGGFLMLLLAPTARGQIVHPGRAPRDFGAGNVNVLQIPAGTFLSLHSGDHWTSGSVFSTPADAGYLRPLGVAPGEYVAGVDLPQGALLDALVLYYDDPSTDHSVFAGLYALSGFDGSNTGATLLGSVVSPGSSGKGYATATLSHSVNKSIFLGGSQYVVYVQASGLDTGFRGVEIWWERQMSAAPATATFSDVPTTHPFFRAIEAFSASGITSGCGGGNFCPNQPVTRQEVAKFFARALGLSYDNNIF